MSLDQVLIGILVLCVFLVYNEIKLTQRLNRSWQKMNTEFHSLVDPNTYGSIAWKTYYSKQLLSRLYPALKHANLQSWETGYYHALVH